MIDNHDNHVKRICVEYNMIMSKDDINREVKKLTSNWRERDKLVKHFEEVLLSAQRRSNR